MGVKKIMVRKIITYLYTQTKHLFFDLWFLSFD